MIRKLIACALTVSVVSASLPPGCLAGNGNQSAAAHRGVEWTGRAQFSRPTILRGFPDFAGIIANSLSAQQTPAGQLDSAADGPLSPAVLAALASDINEAARVFRRTQGPVSIQWDFGKHRLEYTPMLPQAGAQTPGVQETSGPRERALVASLVQKLGETADAAAMRAALIAFYHAASDPHQTAADMAGRNAEEAPRFHWVGSGRAGLLEVDNADRGGSPQRLKYWPGQESHGQPQPRGATSVHAVHAQWEGKILDIHIPRHINEPGTSEAVPTVKSGDEVPRAGTLAAVIGHGAAQAEAAAAAKAAMSGIKIQIDTFRSLSFRLPWIGKNISVKMPLVMEQTGEASHPPAEASPAAPVPGFWLGRMRGFLAEMIKRAFVSSEGKPATDLTPAEWKILDDYEASQMAWVPIFPVYNPSFSAFMLAVLGIAGIGVGAMGYTLALIVSSSIASVISGWSTTRRVYSIAWPARMLIYTAGFGLALWLLPATPVLFTVPLLGPLGWLHLGSFALSFVDGLVVSFTSSRDMDMMGLNMVSKEYGFERKLAPKIQNYYDARYSAANSRAQLIWPPLIGGLAILGTLFSLPVSWVFLGLMGGVFLLQGSRALYRLWKLPRATHVESKQWRDLSEDYKFGLSLAWNVRKFRDRLGLEALERSWWDGMRKVVFLMLGTYIFASALGAHDGMQKSLGNFIGNLLLAAASFGAILAARILKSRWIAPPDGSTNEYPYYRYFFPLIALAGLATLCFPAAAFLASASWPWLSAAAAVTGAFLFGLSFEPSRLGAGNMMKKAAKEYDAGTRIAGVSTSVRQTLSSVAVVAMASLFQHFISPQGGGAAPNLGRAVMRACLAASLFFVSAGMVSWFFGRKLPSGSPHTAAKPVSAASPDASK